MGYRIRVLEICHRLLNDSEVVRYGQLAGKRVGSSSSESQHDTNGRIPWI